VREGVGLSLETSSEDKATLTLVLNRKKEDESKAYSHPPLVSPTPSLTVGLAV
jgi:hypothetical protein